MNFRTIFISAAVAAIFLSSCGDGMKSAELIKTLKTSDSYNGKQIELTGDIELYHDLTIEADSTLEVGLHAGSGTDVQIASFPLHFGKTKNSIYINTKADGSYQESDITLYDNAGNELRSTTGVKVKAKVHYGADDKASAKKFRYTFSDITIEKSK